MDERLATSLHTGVLVAVVGAFAWATGLPALFPSLGPSAFVLATVPDGEASDPRRVVLGHAVGVAAGLLAYHLLGGGVVVTERVAPFSPVGLRLAASGALAIALTVVGMLEFRVRHPPACATTLIVALGLLSTPFEGVLIVVAVLVLVGLQAAVVRVDALTTHLGWEGPGRSRSE
jgi:CBS-domain-containing membrane protein